MSHTIQPIHLLRLTICSKSPFSLSSNSHTIMTIQTCSTCLTEIPIEHSVSCQIAEPQTVGSIDCLQHAVYYVHRFCYDCVQKYVESAVFLQPLSKNGCGMPCMDPECKRIIKSESFSTLISQSAMRHFQERYEQEKEFSKNDKRTEMMLEIKNLQDRLSNDSIRTCKQCGIRYFKEFGCNLVRCRCGTKQCNACGELIFDGIRTIHWTRRANSYHQNCYRMRLHTARRQVRDIGKKYNLSRKQLAEYFPHIVDEKLLKVTRYFVAMLIISFAFFNIVTYFLQDARLLIISLIFHILIIMVFRRVSRQIISYLYL